MLPNMPHFNAKRKRAVGKTVKSPAMHMFMIAHVHDSTCYRQWLAGLRGKRNEIGKILGIALFDYGKSEK